MSLNRKFFLIQNQETYDAIMNWNPAAIDGSELTTFKDIDMTYPGNTLDAQGLPKADGTLNITPSVSIDYNPQPRQLADGNGDPTTRWVLSGAEARKWWIYWKKNAANGGLAIDDGQGGTRNVNKKGNDIAILDESFAAAIKAAVYEPPTE